jgi:hypothetical protein
VCYGPMGVPVLNVTLADHIEFLLSTDETKQEMRDEGEPLLRKRQCLERPLPAYAAPLYLAQAQAALEASITYKALCLDHEEAFAAGVEEACAQVRASADTEQSQFRTRTAAVLEMLQCTRDKAEIHALQAGFHQQGAPSPLPVCIPPPLQMDTVKTTLAAIWRQPPTPSSSYVLYADNEMDGGETRSPPLAAANPADVVRMLLSKSWKDPASPCQAHTALEEIYSQFMNCTASNMLPRHLRYLADNKGRYDAVEGVLRVTTIAGWDRRRVPHPGDVHTFTMDAVAAYIGSPEAEQSNGTWMRLQVPVDFSAWARPTPHIDHPAHPAHPAPIA